MEIDEDKVDDAVLALLRLTLHDKVVFGLRGREAWMRQIKHVARRQWSAPARHAVAWSSSIH